MKNKVYYLAAPLLAALAMFISIWGPEALSRYQDSRLLGQVHRQEVDLAGEG